MWSQRTYQCANTDCPNYGNSVTVSSIDLGNGFQSWPTITCSGCPIDPVIGPVPVALAEDEAIPPPVYIAAENYVAARRMASEVGVKTFWYLPGTEALQGRHGGTLLVPGIAPTPAVLEIIQEADSRGMKIKQVAW